MEMLFVYLSAGVLLIVCGLLVKRFPMLIAGYNTMSAEKRKNVDVEGLASFMRRHLVAIGVFWAGLALLLEPTGQGGALPLIYGIYTPVYAIWIVVRAQRFDRNK